MRGRILSFMVIFLLRSESILVYGDIPVKKQVNPAVYGDIPVKKQVNPAVYVNIPVKVEVNPAEFRYNPAF
jgi:hypothetical protein